MDCQEVIPQKKVDLDLEILDKGSEVICSPTEERAEVLLFLNS